MDFLQTPEAKGGYPPSYYAATAHRIAEFPALDGDHRFDVCVIGAGYTGLSAALHLAGNGYKVAVLEAQRIAWGASGRNGGQVGSGQRVDQETLESMVGSGQARLLWNIAEDAKSLVKQLVAKHGIECDLKSGVINADHKERYVAGTRAYVHHLHEKYDYQAIQFLDRAALREHIGTDVYYGGSIDWSAGHLHPLNFALGIARAAREAGAYIFEQTGVTGIERGQPSLVKTRTGNITADHVLLACNGYLGDLVPEVAERVMPINSYIIATEPLDKPLAREIIRDDVAVADSRFVVNYFRLSSDRRLLFGGRESYGYTYPEDIASAVRQRMLAVYPQLAKVRIDYSWGGTLGITMNRMPHLARLAPNILTASGYSGHGVAMATLCGQLMGDAIMGTAERFDVMASVPTHRFPGGMAFRRPLLFLAMVYYALRDRI